MTLDLEANEVEVKVLTSLASVTETTGGRDKDKPEGWLYDWKSIATMERQNRETRWVESSLVVYLCYCSYYL
jgi:hypothetical protein